MIRRILAVAVCLMACGPNLAGAKDGAAERVFALHSIGSTTVTTRVTLEFADDNRVVGAAPCNRYSAQQTAEAPDFTLGPIAATRRACPDLELETRYFRALEDASTITQDEKTLTLHGENSETLVFHLETE